MRYVDENHNDIPESNIDLGKGKIIETRGIRPDAKPIDNITKFAWDDGDYETVLRYIRIPDEELIENEIMKLKQNLTNTDYCILKVVEGVASLSDYKEVIANRKNWRNRINELEVQFEALKGSAKK